MAFGSVRFSVCFGFSHSILCLGAMYRISSISSRPICNHVFMHFYVIRSPFLFWTQLAHSLRRSLYANGFDSNRYAHIHRNGRALTLTTQHHIQTLLACGGNCARVKIFCRFTLLWLLLSLCPSRSCQASVPNIADGRPEHCVAQKKKHTHFILFAFDV